MTHRLYTKLLANDDTPALHQAAGKRRHTGPTPNCRQTMTHRLYTKLLADYGTSAVIGQGTDLLQNMKIVANKEHRIDVDKWDYFARDCLMLGLKNSFEHMRLMKTARVLNVGGELHICFRDKEAADLYDVFHRRAYQHKISQIIECMSADALVKADDHLRSEGKKGPVHIIKLVDIQYREISHMTTNGSYKFQFLD